MSSDWFFCDEPEKKKVLTGLMVRRGYSEVFFRGRRALCCDMHTGTYWKYVCSLGSYCHHATVDRSRNLPNMNSRYIPSRLGIDGNEWHLGRQDPRTQAGG